MVSVLGSSPAMNDIYSFLDNLICDREAYGEYISDLNYSEGFYVNGGSLFLGGIRAVRECSDHLYQKAEAAARFAVEAENKKRGEKETLKFIKIVNLNHEPSAGAIYYITLVAEEYSGEVKHFQAKIWEKLHSGYQVQIFRVAPYCANFSEIRIGGEGCCVWIHDLQPWMDENYLFYKCFFRHICQELLGVKIVRNEKTGMCYGELQFANRELADKVLGKYDGKRMPQANQHYKLEMAPSRN